MKLLGHPAAAYIPLANVTDERGSLSVAEAGIQVPFPIHRVFFISNVPSGANRGGHAHKSLHEMLISAVGAVDVTVDDGRSRRCYRLESPGEALYLPPTCWRELHHFRSQTLIVVLASAPYDEGDYVRDYEAFQRMAGVSHGTFSRPGTGMC